MRVAWDMESGEFDTCWCAEDGCYESARNAGWDPAIVNMQEQVALQMASEIVTRSQSGLPAVTSIVNGEVEDFLQRMYVFQR